MNDVLMLLRGFAAGALLGTIFYGGLWCTVRRLAVKSQHLWLFGSFLLRSALVLVAFYAFARNDWQGLAACFLGFLGARIIVSHLVRSSTENASHVAREAHP
jgi:F1F0 ATPase subunit 2